MLNAGVSLLLWFCGREHLPAAPLLAPIPNFMARRLGMESIMYVERLPGTPYDIVSLKLNLVQDVSRNKICVRLELFSRETFLGDTRLTSWIPKSDVQPKHDKWQQGHL